MREVRTMRWDSLWRQQTFYVDISTDRTAVGISVICFNYLEFELRRFEI